jgi:hypothetical protein
MSARRSHKVVAALALGLGTALVCGQDPEVDAARLVVADLASESWPDRIAASMELSELAKRLDPATALQTLEAALRAWMEHRAADEESRGDLSEVLARFELEAMQAFFNAPRAGLGITYDPAPTARGVRLGATVEGFDAHGKLRAGDVVLALSGASVEAGSMDLPVAIASHLPGEECVISLLRNGEPMDLTVVLGRRENLNSVRRLEDPVLRRAWALRMERVRGDRDHRKLDADGARSVVVVPPATGVSRFRAVEADVALGGQPGQYASRRAGVVAQVMPGNDTQSVLKAELSRLNGELARVVRRAIDIEETVRQMELEIRMIADTVQGREHASTLRARIAELRKELGPLQMEQTRLMQERTRVIQALSQ